VIKVLITRWLISLKSVLLRPSREEEPDTRQIMTKVPTVSSWQSVCYSGFKSKMTSRRRGSRRRRRTGSTLRSRRRANDNLQSKLDREGAPQGGGRRPRQDAALIWNWSTSGNMDEAVFDEDLLR
jgi:hypothetical protein